MNGYEVNAAAYRKAAENETDTETRNNLLHEAALLDIMAGLSDGDRKRLFDTGAFNDVCRGYTRAALDRAGIDRDKISDVMATLGGLFDEMDAAAAERYYLHG